MRAIRLITLRAVSLPMVYLVAAIAIAAGSLAQAQERPLAEMPLPVIRVIGEGRASLAPDMAVLTLGVLREAASARDALSANNQAMSRVLESMKEAGIEERDLQTSNFSIQPVYSRPRSGGGDNQAPKITGYSVSNQLTVRIRNLERLGAIIDRSVSLGVNTNGGISFTNDDPSQTIAKARSDAMKDALLRAQTLAEAANVELGELLEISESFSQPTPRRIDQVARMSVAEAAVPIAGGENTYTVTVQASWSLRQ